MNTMTRPPQTRASNGRTFILLGILLALAAGTIVIYVVSNYTVAPQQLVTVVVAKADIHAGTVLTAGASDATHTAIVDAFITKRVNTDFAPTNAYTFTSQEALNSTLNNQVVVATIYAGEILRQADPRLTSIGNAASGSLNMIDPRQLAAGSVIMQIQLSGKPAVVPGDHVDVLVTECDLPGAKDPSHCETQTTLQDIYVYAVREDFVFVVLKHQDALTLKYLAETGKVDLAIRQPDDSTIAATDTVNPSYIVGNFGY